MTVATTAFSRDPDSAAAGADLGRSLRQGLGGEAAQAVVVFASAVHDYERLLGALAEGCGTDVIVGASSAGEFARGTRGEGCVTAMALRSGAMRFAVGCATGLAADPAAAARTIASRFNSGATALPYRAALVMADALAGHTDALVEHLTLATGGNHAFFGGGAGDDGRFSKTHVFSGGHAYTDAAVALEIQSERPLGIGVAHGWTPAGPAMRVTEVEGNRLIGLDGAPAVEAFEAFAERTGQAFDRRDPLPFFLHQILGIDVGGGQYRLRVPLQVEPDGSVTCAAAIPPSALVHIMKTSVASAVSAAEQAAAAAVRGLGGRPVGAALVFDCVATRLRMGQSFADELEACTRHLGAAGFVGCNTYGQIARAEGQFGGFHNCTAVVCALPG